MRYPTAHKNQTRQRILDISSGLFKKNGIDATGVATIMREAKLTNGAFYAHFDSKETLVKAVIVNQLELKLKTFWGTPGETVDLEDLIALYLSPEHRDDFIGGCPSAALLDEIGRRTLSTKQAYSDNLLEFVSSIKKRFPNIDNDTARSLAFSLYGLLVGTVQLSRAVADEKISNQILESGRTAAYTLLRNLIFS